MSLNVTIAIGLQYGFKSFFWLSTVPPILFVIAFKVWIDKTFYRQFLYHIPTQDELREAKVHSSRADTRDHRLETRFGHPALRADLFTPMLHAKMMPLLRDVYKGKIGTDKAKLDEYGGRKMDTQVIEGGIKFAGIEQVSNRGYPFSFSVCLLYPNRGTWNTTRRCIDETEARWIVMRARWLPPTYSVTTPTTATLVHFTSSSHIFIQRVVIVAAHHLRQDLLIAMAPWVLATRSSSRLSDQVQISCLSSIKVMARGL